MLVIDNVRIQLADKHWLFNFTLDTHGMYVLLGRSGSGKSTLLNTLAGFTTPLAGDITWNSKTILQQSPAERPITSLFQQNNLFNHLSVFQNIGLGVSPDLKLSTKTHQEILTVLESVGLEGYENKLPTTLSGGEQQRVALARCLLRRRPILLLDEPFSALDTATREEMISLTKRVITDHQLCALMVTHDESDALSLNASSLLMNDVTS